MRRAPRSKQAPAEAAFLPEAELEVLACLHRLDGAEIATIREKLDKRRPMSHASVATLLRRLEARGLVTREKAAEGKAFVYRAAAPAEQTYRSVVQRLAERIFDNDKIGVVSSLFGGQPPSADELAQLRDLVDRLEARRGGRSRRRRR